MHLLVIFVIVVNHKWENIFPRRRRRESALQSKDPTSIRQVHFATILWCETRIGHGKFASMHLCILIPTCWPTYFWNKVKYAQHSSEFADIAQHVLNIFSIMPIAQVFYRQNRDPIIYSKIYKCANNGIRGNLLRAFSTPETHNGEVLVHEAATIGVYIQRRSLILLLTICNSTRRTAGDAARYASKGVPQRYVYEYLHVRSRAVRQVYIRLHRVCLPHESWLHFSRTLRPWDGPELHIRQDLPNPFSTYENFLTVSRSSFMDKCQAQIHQLSENTPSNQQQRQ